MMTKVNRSFHETIIIILSVRLGSDENTSPDYPGKYIILSRVSRLQNETHTKFVRLHRCNW
nr:MAG TPA: hypothetical protein [Caudoviricetes sp.]